MSRLIINCKVELPFKFKVIELFKKSAVPRIELFQHIVLQTVAVANSHSFFVIFQNEERMPSKFPMELTRGTSSVSCDRKL